MDFDRLAERVAGTAMTGATKRETVKVDWNDLASIRSAERKKSRLENLGYTLVETLGGLTTSQLVYVKKEEEANKWGFDTTHFGSAQVFASVVRKVGIDPKQAPERGSMGEFVWKGPGLTLVTGNNPVTGEYMAENRRAPEEGYASYIGIEGNPDKVRVLADAIRAGADWKDESPGERSFI